MLGSVCQHDLGMGIADILGIGGVDDFDPSRPVVFGRLELGLEAAAEVARLLANRELKQVRVRPRDIQDPSYWALSHQTEGEAELFAYPVTPGGGLPTANEVAIVRALSVAEGTDIESLKSGGVEVALGPPAAWTNFAKVFEIASQPNVGSSVLYGDATQAVLRSDTGSLLEKTSLQCLANSFIAAPIKFRFLELYRAIEARFLYEVKQKLFQDFDISPGIALADASDALKTEFDQIQGLASIQREAFERCWDSLRAIKDTNRLASALFRTVEKKGRGGNGKAATGAALIYQLRCAIVHAGTKDIIYESYPDGDQAVEVVIKDVERTALSLIGIDIQ